MFFASHFGLNWAIRAISFRLDAMVAEDGTKLTWFDPIKNENCNHILHKNDPIIWLRFWLSFLINGLGKNSKRCTLASLLVRASDSCLTFACFNEGYHMLVHALPIQVAAQSTFGGVVARAVGMMYIVDLDNTSNVFDMTLIPAQEEENEKVQKSDDTKGTIDASMGFGVDKSSVEDTATSDDSYSYFLKSMTQKAPKMHLATIISTKQIIEEARQEIDRIMESTHKKLAALNHGTIQG